MLASLLTSVAVLVGSVLAVDEETDQQKRACVERAVTLAADVQDDADRARLFARVANHRARFGDLAGCRSALSAAREAVAGDPAAAAVLVASSEYHKGKLELFSTLLGQGQLAEAQTLVPDLLASRFGDRETIVGMIACYHAKHNDLPDAIAAAGPISSPEGRRIRSWLVSTLAEKGDYDQARVLAQELERAGGMVFAACRGSDRRRPDRCWGLRRCPRDCRSDGVLQRPSRGRGEDGRGPRPTRREGSCFRRDRTHRGERQVPRDRPLARGPTQCRAGRPRHRLHQTRRIRGSEAGGQAGRGSSAIVPPPRPGPSPG